MGAIEVNGRTVWIKPTRSNFRQSYAYLKNEILRELQKIGIDKDFVELPPPQSCGNATITWWINQQKYSYTSSSQQKFISNLGVAWKVISMDCYAIRNGLKPFGTTMSQYQIGYAGQQAKTPRQILGIPEHINDLEYITFKYKLKAKELHPDVGGSTEAFQELQKAYEELQKELGRKT